MSKANLLEIMTAQGYKCIAPNIEVVFIDTEIIARLKCPKCHNKMECEPYSMVTPFSYRAFAVCSKCEYWEEF